MQIEAFLFYGIIEWLIGKEAEWWEKSSSSFYRVYVAMLVTGILGLDDLWKCSAEVGPAGTTVMSLYAEKMACPTKTIVVTRLGTLQGNLHSQSSLLPYLPLKGFFSMACTSWSDSHEFLQILVLLFNLVFLLVAPLAYAVYLKLQSSFRSLLCQAVSSSNWSECCWNVVGSEAHPWTALLRCLLLYANPSLSFLIDCMAFSLSMISLTLFINSTKNWYP